MAPRADKPQAADNNDPSQPGQDQDPGQQQPGYRLTPEREAELLVQARDLGDDLRPFPGRTARRVVWYSRIQLTAERDAADLIRTPFPDDEQPLTLVEIQGMRDKIELLRVTQSRWSAVYRTQHEADVTFQNISAEAAEHKQTLLRFFDLRLKNDPEGRRRLSAIREGRGDADLVQDVSDLLVLCGEHSAAIAAAPRDEAKAVARLTAMSPELSRLLADKTLTPQARAARKLRDAAYTLVYLVERRIRTAAEYWYGGTDKLKPYAPFPTMAPGGSAEVDEEEVAEAAPEAEPEPEPPPAEPAPEPA